MPALSEMERQEFAASYPEWELREHELQRTFDFPDFVAAMGFVAMVGLLAERSGHHPEISIRSSRVELTLTTPPEGILTRRDTDLAAAIDAIV